MPTPLNSTFLQVDAQTGTTTYTFTASFTFTAGSDAILKLVSYDDNGTFLTGATIGGTTATRDAYLEKFSVSSNSIHIFRAQNIAGGTANVVVSFTNAAGTHYITGNVEEYASGVFLNPAVDGGTANTATGTSAAPSVSTAATTSQANTSIHAVTLPNTGIANNNITGPTGWTVSWTEQDSAIHEAGRGAYIDETTTGTKTATFGMTSGSWGAIIVAYKLAGGGGGGNILMGQVCT